MHVAPTSFDNDITGNDEVVAMVHFSGRKSLFSDGGGVLAANQGAIVAM